MSNFQSPKREFLDYIDKLVRFIKQADLFNKSVPAKFGDINLRKTNFKSEYSLIIYSMLFE
jgi:hypothetical protein